MENKNMIVLAFLATGMLLPLCGLGQNQPAPSANPGVIFEPAVTNREPSIATGQDWRTLNPAMPQPPEPGPARGAAGPTMGPALAGTSQLGGGAPPPAAPEPLDTPLRWGKLSLHPHAAYAVSYAEGLNGRLGQEADSWIHEFMPGMMVRLGDRWSLDYTPILRWYSNDDFTDGVDHRVSFRGGAEYRDWQFSVAQGFARTRDPLIETGRETEQDTYSTTIRAARPLNSSLSIDLGVGQDLRFIRGDSEGEALSDTKTWSTMNWLDYQYIERLSFGVGAGFAYDSVETGSDMTSEQVQARTRWAPGSKLSLTASAGVDIRQFVDSDEADSVSPIFSVGAGYVLTDTTTLSLSASRTVTPSYYDDTLSEGTIFSAGLVQRLLGRFYLNVTGGYALRDYSGTTGTSAATGDQETVSFNASLGTAFLTRGYISVFYNKSWNDSDSATYDLDPQTVGLQISYSY